MSAALPEIDVVIPAYDEEQHLGDCLDHVDAQDYPRELIRIWVVDAGSTDATPEVVRRRAEGDPRIELIRDGRRMNAAEAVNLGVSRGSAPVMARIDAHTYPYPDYLSRAVAALEAEGDGVACVGAQPEQEGVTRFGEAVALARTSSFGVGGSGYADKRERAYVETIQAGVYRRSAWERMEGFDTSLPHGEDEELNWRLRQAGYRLLMDTSIRFRYTTRSSWRALFRQYRNYGRSRMLVIAAHPEFLRPYHLAPAGLVGLAGALAAASPCRREARVGLGALAGAYGAGAGAAALAATSGNDRSLAPRVAAAFAALHFGYGVGLIEGASRWLRSRS